MQHWKVQEKKDEIEMHGNAWHGNAWHSSMLTTVSSLIVTSMQSLITSLGRYFENSKKGEISRNHLQDVQ